MATMNDPVGNGLVASLARPGGNTTGLASMNEDVTPKLVEFLHVLFPRADSIAVFFNPTNPSNRSYLESVRSQVAPRGIAVQAFAVHMPGQLDTAFGAMSAQRLDALLIIPDAATLDLAARIAALALQHRIPVISTYSDLTRAGGLISHGFSRRENYRRSAYYVKRILDGAKPADLPVEQPTRILMAVNLKTAKTLGLTIPNTLLASADEVIE